VCKSVGDLGGGGGAERCVWHGRNVARTPRECRVRSSRGGGRREASGTGARPGR
jgi:hypothetical protein